MIKRFAIIILLSAALSGCGWVKARKIPVQQGNKITQTMVDQVKPGMSPAQVEKIMGPPILMNTFTDQSLHYVYTIDNDKEDSTKRVVFTFKNNKLAQISGSLYPRS